MTATITAIVTTIPPRRRLLARAVASVRTQTRPADQILTPCDTAGAGAAANRNRAIEEASGEWCAFLDDDDLWYGRHLQLLVEHAEQTGADLVYPWFDGVNTDGILATRLDGQPADPFGVPFGPEQADALRAGNFIPVTVLARTSLLRQVGGFTPPTWATPDNPCEDWGCWLKLLDAGARFAHLPKITWRWNGHPNHTSGRAWTDIYPGPNRQAV